MSIPSHSIDSVPDAAHDSGLPNSISQVSLPDRGASALIIPEDYRARAVALHAREYILSSASLSSRALSEIGSRRHWPNSLEAHPAEDECPDKAGRDGNDTSLHGLLEEAIDEAIRRIGGHDGKNGLTQQPENIPSAGTAHHPENVLSPGRPPQQGTARWLRRWKKRTDPPHGASVHTWSYPSVEYVPVNRNLALRYLESELYGLGALDLLIEVGERQSEGKLTDIYVNAPCDIWVSLGGTTRPVALSLGNERRVRALAERLIRGHGGQLDTAHPAADVSDEWRRRIHAIIPPLSERTQLSIRLPARERPSLEQLQKAGLCDEATSDYLRCMVAERRGFVISGGTGTGKTTLLNALLGLCDGDERLILLEDTPELAPRHEQVISLKTRAPNSEGAGEVTLGDLIVQALRMGPDRLVVGECRGAEVVHLLTAMNTGHRGAGTSLHANSAQAVPRRLVALGALAGLDSRTLALHTATAIERIIHLEYHEGQRRIEGIYSLCLEGPEEQLRVQRITVSSPHEACLL